MHSLIQLKRRTSEFLIVLGFVSFGLLPEVQAVSPAPDGGYPNLNTAEGQNALNSLTTGSWNTALGASTLYSDTTGTGNTAVGINTLRHNVTGGFNTAVGLDALYSNVGGPNMGNGSDNSAVGGYALFSNISGYENSAFGFGALASAANDTYNTAVGFFALNFNNGGQSNTAVGGGTLSRNTIGSENTAIGSGAGLSNTTGNNNTATGVNALFDNDTGNNNTANGHNALLTSHGTNNTAMGFQALANNTAGSNNIGIGLNAGLNLTTGNGNIDIGNEGAAGESGTTRIGAVQTKTFISGIRGVTTGNADAIPVLIDSFGQLGTMSSSRRFKKEVKRMDKASEAILALRPVTFQYKNDSKGAVQFGLIAEDVAAVNPDLIVHDKEGKPYTVRYDAVNAMLLNEFLKEHRKVERLEKQVAALTAGLQKVSAQLATARPSLADLR